MVSCEKHVLVRSLEARLESSTHSGYTSRQPLLLKRDSHDGFVGHRHVAVPLMNAPPTARIPHYEAVKE